MISPSRADIAAAREVGENSRERENRGYRNRSEQLINKQNELLPSFGRDPQL